MKREEEVRKEGGWTDGKGGRRRGKKAEGEREGKTKRSEGGGKEK